MSLFQILTTLFILILLIAISRTRTVLLERILFIVVTLGGVYFVFFPQSAQILANLLGIGRGADLIFYLYIIFSWFYFTSISTKMRRTDRKLTEIVRAQAVSDPQFGNGSKLKR
jgi:small membrane protein